MKAGILASPEVCSGLAALYKYQNIKTTGLGWNGLHFGNKGLRATWAAGDVLKSNWRITSQGLQDGLSSLSPPTVTMNSPGHLKAEVNTTDSDLLISYRCSLLKTKVGNSRI